MNQRTHTLLWVAGALFAAHLSASGSEWHSVTNARWTPSPPVPEHEPGFTLLNPGTTGLAFTNTLDEWSSAANRVLENGSGVAAGDFDGDGRPDLFFCSLTGQNALFRNLGNWQFTNVTVSAGITAQSIPCRGAVFADVNGDGWPDLLISTLQRGVICYLNDGHGRFTDVTSSAGTQTQFGSTTLALADVDGNGTLDLYVANYRSDDIRDRSRIDIQRVDGQVTLVPWLRDRLMLTQAGVVEFGEPDFLYLNDGQGHFSPVSWTDGTFLDEDGKPLNKAPLDWGLNATFRDLNGDGLPDLYVCNDYWTPDRVWINQGQGRFRAIAPFALRHTSENSMGVDFADIDRDGQVDGIVLDMLSREPALRKRQALAQTKILPPVGNLPGRPQIMRNVLLHNRGDGTFEDIADFAGLPASDWSWQPVFIDVDLDGFDDLIIPAGHRRDVQDLDATERIRALQQPLPKSMDPKAHQNAFTRRVMEHSRHYPSLDRPIIAFRNTGQLRFEEKTSEWGTSTPGVHQGIAFADLDGDGDLDFVVNNLNGPCGVYRNDCSAPRVAVRLKGVPPNTDGIGAKVTLRGVLPEQTEEMVCGGRYLSGFQPLLVFATGRAAGGMVLRVHWRGGGETLVESVQANRLYEIEELGSGTRDQRSVTKDEKPRPRLFDEVSARLAHLHVENDFDDLARQPLLPRQLSRLGPGAAWFDLNGDGHEDLIVGSGRGGHLAIWHGDGHGGFQRAVPSPADPPCTRDQAGLVVLSRVGQGPVILVGSANYEDALPAGPLVRQFASNGGLLEDTLPGASSTTGPLALGDFDGRGTLDLFVGGRVVPGRYPEPASSSLYRLDGGHWLLDKENSRLLEKVGLVAGAVWSDLDGDGLPELILACEWGPLRLFKNVSGRLEEVTAKWRLTEHTGWWTGVATGDFDGDGRLDIVAANWGLNSPYQTSAGQPVRLFYGDLMQRGTVDIIETEFDPPRKCLTPMHRLDFMAAGLPFLRERFTSFKAFSEATIDDVLGDLRARASEWQASTLASTLFLNRGDHFEAHSLPPQAQFAPAFGVTVADFDGDGHEDVFLSQNFFDLHWQTPRQDAGRGLLLLGDGTGQFQAAPGQTSGIEVYEQQRGCATADFNEDGRADLVVTQNGAATKLFVNVGARPGLRVRLRGTKENPQGIGASVRLLFGNRFGPTREVHAGSGYWSQDSAVQVMGTPEQPTDIWVRWPGGAVTTNSLPASAREVVVDISGKFEVVR